jgi:hypothetical protein
VLRHESEESLNDTLITDDAIDKLIVGALPIADHLAKAV